jgi:hypothetical protein
MTEYSRIAKGNFTAASGQTTAVVNLPFQPDRVEIFNYTNIKSAAANVVARAWWFSNLIDGANNPTMVEIYNGSTAVVFDTIQTNGISTFAAGLALQYGATQQVIGITKAALARVNVTAHGYNIGDTVILQGIATGVTNNAMRFLNGVPFTIEAVSDADHFDIQWNTNQSSYTAISGSPTGALVKKVLYPFLYLPEDNVVSAVTRGATTTVVTTMYHNFEVGQEIAFRVPTIWGTTQLNSLPNTLIPGSPVYGYVTSITDNWTFVCNINSTGFTAFTTNQTTVPSNWTPAQVLAVGDVNTGGNIISAGSPLYPSPQFPTSTNRVPTINGPAIRGAFVNNTSQGFIIGAGVTAVDTNAASAILTPSQANQIAWVAYLDDMQIP